MKLALSSLPRSPRRRSGFTLLEVALALAIFLIGALAIVRIFPGGLSSVERSENDLRASDINKTALARLTSNGSVPRSVFYGDLSSTSVVTTWNPFSGSVLGPPRPNDSLPLSTGLTAYYNSALANQMTINAEPAQLERANLTDNFRVFTQFPVAVTRDLPLSTATPEKLVNVYEEDDLDGARIVASGSDRLLDLSQATFRKSGLSFAAQTSQSPGGCTVGTTDCAVYVSYRYTTGTGVGNVSGITDEMVDWGGPVATASNWTNVTRFTTAIPGSVQVRFRHKLANPVIASDIDAHLGYLPSLTLVTPITTTTADLSTKTTFPVTLDYPAGWGSYSLTRDIPSLTPQTQYSTTPFDPASKPVDGEQQLALGAPFTFARGTLPLCFLLNDGGTLSTISFNGSVKSATPATAANQLLLKDDTEIAAITLDQEKDIALRERRTALRTGRISFNMSGNPAKQVRAAYATRDSWIQQLAVANSSYTPYVASTPTISDYEPWRDYYLDNGYLYFRPTEAGKTVQVTYTTTNSGIVTTTTTVATIEQRIINTPSAVNSAFPNTRVARLAIYRTDGVRITAPSGILDVRGLSVSMRTAWLERDRWTQNITTSMRGGTQ